MNACNGLCHSLVPHRSHLFIGSGPSMRQYALRVTPHGATCWLPDGSAITQRQPEALDKLKRLVREQEGVA